MDKVTETLTEARVQPKDSEVEIPFTLKEYGEIPQGFVPVYIAIKKESMKYVSEKGFRCEDNRMQNHNTEIEVVFSQVAKEMGIKMDRTQCVFAHPRHPDKIPFGLKYRPERDVLIRAMIDPGSMAMVCEGEYYGDAVRDMDKFGVKEVRPWAKSYWETSKSLQQYLDEGHTGSEDDWYDFTMPEVLISEDIPTSRLKIISD